MKKYLIVAIALLVAAPAFGQDWKADWDKTVVAAKKEGALVLSVPSGNIWRGYLMAFGKAYPEIKVEMTPFASRDYWPRVVKEREAGQYLWDLRVGGADALAYRLRDQGHMQEIRSLLVLPEVTDESKWIGGFNRMFLDKEKKYFPAFIANVSQTANYNSKFVPKTPTIEDLLKPEWVGKMSMADPRGGSALNSLAVMTKVHGEGMVRKFMVDQQMVITSDPRQQLKWLVSGRYPVAFGLPSATFVEYENRGGSVAEFKDVDGLKQWAPGVGALQLTTRAPHPNAVKVFVNWILTRDVQAALAPAVKLNSMRNDVPVAAPDIALDVARLGDYHGTQDEAIEPYMKRTQDLLKEILK
jgi:iron(III) transport system substrate-binding protein